MTAAEWDVLARSLRVAAWATALVLPLGGWIAHGVEVQRWRWGWIADGLARLPLVLPPVAVGLALLWAFGPATPLGRAARAVGVEVVFAEAGAILAGTVVALPLVVATLRVGFARLDADVQEAARIDGAGRWARLWRLTLPLTGHAWAAAAALAFGRALGEFGATIVVAGSLPGRTQTLPLALYQALNAPDGRFSAGRILAISAALAVLTLALHTVLSRRLQPPPP